MTAESALTLPDEVRAIPLGGAKARGRVALVDASDYEVVSVHRWHVIEQVTPSGSIRGPYAATKVRQRHVSMHGLITGYAVTDHINHDGLDNRRFNLRLVTNAQNNHNQRPVRGSSSRFKGVFWNRRSRVWHAAIKVPGKRRHLGCFSTEEEAAAAYDLAARDAYGEYAYLNFPGAA